jgi:hypothetical protein
MAAQLSQSIVLDRRIPVRESYNSADPVSIPNLKMHRSKRETGKQIAREHRLCNPNKALTCRPFESNTRTERSHILQLTKMRRRDVLVLGLGPKAIPSQLCCFCRLPLAGYCPVHGNPWFPCFGQIRRATNKCRSSESEYRLIFRFVKNYFQDKFTGYSATTHDKAQKNQVGSPATKRIQLDLFALKSNKTRLDRLYFSALSTAPRQNLWSDFQLSALGHRAQYEFRSLAP